MRVLIRGCTFLLTLTMFYILSVGVGAYLRIGNLTVIENTLDRRLDAGDTTHTLTRFRDIDKFRQVDIVVAGSSHAARGFDPRVFAEASLTLFNMGTTAQTPFNSYFLLEKYQQQLQPKLVIYEIYPEILSQDGFESFIDLAANMPLSPEIVEMGASTQNPSALNALVAIQWLRLRHPLEQTKQRANAGDTYVSGGYVAHMAVRDTLAPPKRATWSPTQKQLAYLSKLIDFAQATNAKIVLVSVPIPRELRESISNYDEVNAHIGDFAGAKGISYIDLNEELALDSHKHFFDRDHLNTEGARIADGVLITMLRERNLIDAN